MSETAGNAERRIDPVRRIETAMAQASAWGLEFIKSIDDLKSENARLSERVKELEERLQDVLKQKGGDLLINFQTEMAIQRQEKERLNARLTQAEGLLEEALSEYDTAIPLVRYRHVDIYDTWADETRAFLHPEKEENSSGDSGL